MDTPIYRTSRRIAYPRVIGNATYNQTDKAKGLSHKTTPYFCLSAFCRRATVAARRRAKHSQSPYN